MKNPVGVVPILWNNVDVPDVQEPIDAVHVLDEIERLGFDGCQHGVGFLEGAELRADLARRGLRLAEVYAALPCSANGPTEAALEVGRERLRFLLAGGGEVLVLALAISPERAGHAGKADGSGVPRLTPKAWDRLSDLLLTLAAEARGQGIVAAFHPHAGTFIETPAEAARLGSVLSGGPLGFALDTGHFLVGGGDPAAFIREYRSDIVHLHLKDADPDVLTHLRSGDLPDLHAALRARIFPELGTGALDLTGVLQALGDYTGWIMIEQDTSWRPPSEAAAINRHSLFLAQGLTGGA